MQIVEGLIQGSPAWHAHRRAHFNASDAPAMMGESPYKTRAQLLKEYATGILPEIDSMTQGLFDAGHRAEALARPLAEKIIGDELYPVTAVKGKLSASFDGVTLMEDTSLEHKSINDAIRAAKSGADLPLYLRIQMEQQLDVGETIEKCLFMATRWEGETLIEEVHHWYFPDLDLRAKINAGWRQFEADLANYQHIEDAPKVVAEPVIALPAVAIKVEGNIALQSNLSLFGEKLKEFIAKLDRNPSTDQAFADAEAAVKVFKNAEDALEAAEANALAQTASVDEMRRMVAMLKETARSNRLALEKIVKARKDAIRVEIAQAVQADFAEHIANLNKRLGKPYMPAIAADFSGVMRGLKTITSIRNAVDTEMARAKIEANAIADKLQANLETLRTMAAKHAALFADTPQIIHKANDDLVALIQSRIAAYEKEKAEEAEALRAKIEAEEKAKAEAAAAETMRKEREAMEARTQAVLTASNEQRQAEAQAKLPKPALTPVSPSPAPAATDATLNLGQINERLDGVKVDAQFLERKGFIPRKEGVARLYREADFPAMCQAIIHHIEAQAATHFKAAA